MITIEEMKKILAEVKLMNDFLTRKHEKIKVSTYVDHIFFLDDRYKLIATWHLDVEPCDAIPVTICIARHDSTSVPIEWVDECNSKNLKTSIVNLLLKFNKEGGF